MELIYLIIALCVTISTHETAHAWVAYKLGDPTAKLEGRISLNPLRHLDLLGTLMIFIAHFGWGKPIPYNEYNLRHPRRDSALIALAGPMANLITAFLVALPYKYLILSQTTLINQGFTIFLLSSLDAILSLSLVLFIFNLLPIAPLDGSKFIGVFIPASREFAYRRYLARGPMILILVVVGDSFLGSTLGTSFLQPVIGALYDFFRIAILLIV
ncbi:site-2 protease family protein [Candidatus Peregrinibacteria bacterium]|nr:site-2 protease family protein [Candidatus Peregrinibacteria bacterium]